MREDDEKLATIHEDKRLELWDKITSLTEELEGSITNHKRAVKGIIQNPMSISSYVLSDWANNIDSLYDETQRGLNNIADWQREVEGIVNSPQIRR